MNSTRSKQRIEGDIEPLPGPSSASLPGPSSASMPGPLSASLPGPSSASLPLVAPHLVMKSSKDPNRGMYPHDKRKPSRFNHASSPEFVKASQLVINNHQKVKEVVTIDSSSDEHKALPEQVASNRRKPSRTSYNTWCRRRLLSHFVHHRKRKASIPAKGSPVKITRYLKPSDNSHFRSIRTSPVTNKTQIMKSGVKHKDHHTATTFSWSQNWHKKNEQLLDSITDFEHFFKRQDCYGLVENSVPEEICEDYFKRLPTDVIESILCQIPMLDLLSCRLVCSSWLDIIDRPRFMEWKKVYYRYKKECAIYGQTYHTQIQQLIAHLGYKAVEDCIGTIIKYMGNYFNRIPSSDMHSLLIQNPHGELADRVLSERFPEFNGKDSRVWCQFAMAIIICETTWQIINVYKSLFTSKRSCVRHDVNDAMYSIATFLLYFRSMAKINCGLHYRVYYALYVIENNIPICQKEKIRSVNIPGQQSLHSYGTHDNSYLTYEQIRVLNHRFGINQKIKIVALAGTGKTTTLIHLARLYPQIKFLNLVFNKSVNKEAKKKFPPNVVCRTAHSLAFSAVGKFLRHKLTSSVRPHDLVDYISHNEELMPNYEYACLVLTTINNFAMSDSIYLSEEHVPPKNLNRRSLTPANKNRILLDACIIWQQMIDKNNNFPMTHDVYLKLYHLNRPNLNRFQCIMVDEAQDCNPAMLDIVLSQTMPVVFVGDPHQQIYGFRGALNALQRISATHTYYLTKSFRFGPQISYIASCVLEIMLRVTNKTLVGSTSDSDLSGCRIGQFAIISRTNVVLFNEALRMIVFKQLKPYEPPVIKAAFAGGIGSYGFHQILDIYKLKYVTRAERQLKDRFISRFQSYDELARYAKATEDSDLLSKMELVNQHGHNISNFIPVIAKRCSHPIESANVVFSTAHKSKGLEFDTVALTDDFPITTVPAFLDCESTQEEAHILYVALTRVKKCLLLPERISKVLHLAQEKFEYPVSSNVLLELGPDLKCVVCDDSFVPHTVLVIYKRQTVMSSGRAIREGPLCMKCGTDPYMRPDVHVNNLVMYLDPTRDNYHRFMSSIAGPLPNDPPVIHDRFGEFDNADRVFVINLNIH